MKVLLTSCPTYGHFYPLIPLAWALRSNGHELLAAMPGDFADVAISCGIPAVKLNDSNPFYSSSAGSQGTEHKVWGSETDGSQASRITKAVIDHVIDAYVPLSHATASSMIELCETWGPDLILHTPWEYSAEVAATTLGIPRVTHGWGVSLPPELAAAEAAALAPMMQMYSGKTKGDPVRLHIDICPPSMQFPDAPAHRMRMRYIPFNGAALSQPWHAQRGSRPRVVVSIGSVPIENGHAILLESIIRALSRIEVDAIVLAGRVEVPEYLISSNVRVATENIPLANLMATCDLVVHHGGSGSTMTATAYGLPQLAIPQMCDQFRHSERIEASGCGVQLTNVRPSVEEIYLSIRELLGDERYRRRAQELRSENLTQITPNQMVPYLEAIASRSSPRRLVA